MRNRITVVLLMAGLLALVVPGAVAQERFGSFTGTVTDASGGLLPDVTVTIVNKDTNHESTTKTDSAGVYVFRQIEPGRYQFNFVHTGFNKAEIADALLLVGREIRVNTTLQVASTQQSVDVTEAAPLIDTTGVSNANNITSEEFNNLPKTRSFQSLIALAPSVNNGTIESGYQINGASGAENQFFVDGVSTNSLIDGRSRQNAAFEFLQEVQVKTGGIDAEYGGATGGVVSAITKSGGNAFHGEAHYYWSGNAISAGPVNRLFLFDQFGSGKDAKFVQDSKQGSNTHEVGGSLAGPIFRDKLLFFASISPQFVRRSNDYLPSNGSETDTIKQNQSNRQAFSKVTWNATSKLRVNLSWLWTPTRTEGILPAYDGIANALLTSKASIQSNKTQGWTQPQSNYTGQIDWTVSPTAILTLRGGRFWDNFRTWGVAGFSSITFQTAPTGIPGLPADLAAAQPGYSNTPRRQTTFYDITTQSYYQVDFAKFISRALGSHDLKVGFGTRKGVNRVNLSYPGNGFVYVYWNKTFTQPGTGALVGGKYGYYEVDNIGTVGTTGGTISNIYIQDHWRILPRLTVTLGLRTENEHIPSFRRGTKDEAFSFGFGDKLAPRVGFAWDVKGNGKLKAYASYGRLYGWVPYETSRGSFGGDIYTVYYRSLDTTDVLSLSGTNMPGTNLWPTGPFRDRRVPNFNSVAPDIKPMTTDLFNAGLEYQIAASTVVSANYIGNHLVRTIEDMGVLVNGDEVYQFVNPGEGVASTYLSSGLTPSGFPTPKPIRNYDAMQLLLTRRFAKGFSGQAAYVYSRLYGNYNGLANTDEIVTPTTGVSSGTTQQSGGSTARPGTTGSRAWDLDETLFDASGHFLEGRLGGDRPHMLKLYGNYSHPWAKKFGTSDIGVLFKVESGEPVSTLVETVNDIQIFVNGRGDLGRTPVFSQTDLVVAHEFHFGETKRLRLEMNFVNLFNQKTTLHILSQVNRGANTVNAPSSYIDLSGTNLMKGFDYKAMLAAIAKTGTDPYEPRFGMGDFFNPGMSGRLGLKFTF